MDIVPEQFMNFKPKIHNFEQFNIYFTFLIFFVGIICAVIAFYAAKKLYTIRLSKRSSK